MDDSSGRGSTAFTAAAAVAVVVLLLLAIAGLGVVGTFFFYRKSARQNYEEIARMEAANAARMRELADPENRAVLRTSPDMSTSPEQESPPGAAADEPTKPAGEAVRSPLRYVAYRASEAPHVDGKLDDAAWDAAPWSADFVDIEGSVKPTPRFRTRMKMSWDERYFYVAAQMDEPHVWGTLTEHDSVIFHDNDFEVFLDPDGDTLAYGEFEINALNTGWDLFLPKPYRHGGKADNGWEIPGLQTAIHVDGTLNDPSDEDRGWSVELAFPWEVLGKLSSRAAPPADGDEWRINFSRVEWRHQIVDGKYRKVPDTKEDNWVWSPQGVIDMHRPETWGFVRFSTKEEPDAENATAGPTGDATGGDDRPANAPASPEKK